MGSPSQRLYNRLSEPEAVRTPPPKVPEAGEARGRREEIMPEIDIDCYDTTACSGDCDECEIFKLFDMDEVEEINGLGEKN